MMLKLCCVCGLVGLVAQAAKYDYNYEGKYGPLKWGDVNAQCASKKRQSPIDLTAWDAKIHVSMDDLKLNGYDTALADQPLKNNGHSVFTAIPAPLVKSIGMAGAGFVDAGYWLHSFHFHWAGENHKGSEHTLHGLFYPLELHLVHVRGDLPTLGDALDKGDGLAVLGIFFKLVPEHSAESQSRRPLPLDPVVQGLKGAAANNGNGTMATFKMQDLVPANQQSFFRYEGSLTTPPCSEAVQWTVLTEPQLLTQAQLDAFRKVKLPRVDGGLDTENFRPVQPRGSRPLFLRSPQIDVHGVTAAAGKPLAMGFLGALCLLVSLLSH